MVSHNREMRHLRGRCHASDRGGTGECSVNASCTARQTTSVSSARVPSPPCRAPLPKGRGSRNTRILPHRGRCHASDRGGTGKSSVDASCTCEADNFGVARVGSLSGLPGTSPKGRGSRTTRILPHRGRCHASDRGGTGKSSVNACTLHATQHRCGLVGSLSALPGLCDAGAEPSPPEGRGSRTTRILPLRGRCHASDRGGTGDRTPNVSSTFTRLNNSGVVAWVLSSATTRMLPRMAGSITQTFGWFRRPAGRRCEALSFSEATPYAIRLSDDHGVVKALATDRANDADGLRSLLSAFAPSLSLSSAGRKRRDGCGFLGKAQSAAKNGRAESQGGPSSGYFLQRPNELSGLLRRAPGIFWKNR